MVSGQELNPSQYEVAKKMFVWTWLAKHYESKTTFMQSFS